MGRMRSGSSIFLSACGALIVPVMAGRASHVAGWPTLADSVIPQTLPMPPAIGWTLVSVGAVMLFLGLRGMRGRR